MGRRGASEIATWLAVHRLVYLEEEKMVRLGKSSSSHLYGQFHDRDLQYRGASNCFLAIAMVGEMPLDSYITV